jgi:hypothetical protein
MRLWFDGGIDGDAGSSLTGLLRFCIAFAWEFIGSRFYFFLLCLKFHIYFSFIFHLSS